eukprot:GHVU01056491.1.p1 GENE.GHVU01056491.1~~GHVU01056491.1.p1  ORF type:complete len:192 (+),score=12.57 GHVU01056491.1:87-662(+)
MGEATDSKLVALKAMRFQRGPLYRHVESTVNLHGEGRRSPVPVGDAVRESKRMKSSAAGSSLRTADTFGGVQTGSQGPLIPVSSSLDGGNRYEDLDDSISALQRATGHPNDLNSQSGLSLDAQPPFPFHADSSLRLDEIMVVVGVSTKMFALELIMESLELARADNPGGSRSLSLRPCHVTAAFRKLSQSL